MAITVMASCKKDDPIQIQTEPEGLYENGFFVVNEGDFGTGNSSISFVSNEGTIENNVFTSVNSFALGDVAQSMTIINDKAYIMVNGSGKIEVTNIHDMSYDTTITVSSPRYMAKVSDTKAYVTDWTDGVQVIDLTNNTVSSTITCGIGSEGIVVSNGFAYVCNVGGWGFDNTVSIIDIETDLVVSTLEVGDKPNSVVADVNGDIWVLTEGHTVYDAAWNIVSETAGNLVKITNNTIAESYTFAVGNHPQDLIINEEGTTLYYSDGSWSKAVYAFDITSTELPSSALINKSFYGIGANNGYLYGTDAVDFTQNGWSYKYTSTGEVVDSIQVGIIPGTYCFN